MMTTTSSRLQRLTELRAAAELVKLERNPRAAEWRRAWRAQRRDERAWRAWSLELLTDLRDELPPPSDLAALGQELRRSVRLLVLRKQEDLDPDEVLNELRAGVEWATLEEGAVAGYLAQALETGKASGQYTLDALGLNRTFSWAHPRAMAQALYAVRGSKVVQSAHGTHLKELSRIIERATDPARAQSIGQVTKEIRTRWSGLTKYQAERIARTETAAVWQTTSLNAMRANGVTSFTNLVATGPSIGVQTEPVCPICIEYAANGPYAVGDITEHPPLHPSCRCVLVPTEDFLPPQELWTGGELEDLTATPDFDLAA